jgi:hypothetical protein
MDNLNEYLPGNQLMLYSDHKPLEKLGHLHNKMLNRLQLALMEHDFKIQYKRDPIYQQTTFQGLQELPQISIPLPLFIHSKQSCERFNSRIQPW